MLHPRQPQVLAHGQEHSQAVLNLSSRLSLSPRCDWSFRLRSASAR
jgi:hypothetical protein